MGYKDEQYHRQAQADSWAHLLGYEVYDQAGDKIGTVKALWEDYTRQPAYLGVATSWLDMGRIHVVPAQFFGVSERRKCLRLPLPADVVKGAPECRAEDEITLSGETKIRDYYYRNGLGPDSGRGSAEKPARSGDWSARRRDDDDERGFKERIRDSVDKGKARFARDRAQDGPESYGRPEREMGLPFEEERTDAPLRKITGETPVAEPVQPRRENDGEPRGEEDFLPLRGPSNVPRPEGHDDRPFR